MSKWTGLLEGTGIDGDRVYVLYRYIEPGIIQMESNIETLNGLFADHIITHLVAMGWAIVKWGIL